MDEKIKNWITKADNDLKAAELSLNEPALTDIVCFHSQFCNGKIGSGKDIRKEVKR